MESWKKIFIAIGSGIFLGTIMGSNAAIFLPIGLTFLKILNMLIIPLIFCSMVSGIGKIPKTQDLRKISGIAIILYAISTMCAIALGLFIGFSTPIGASLTDTIFQIEAPLSHPIGSSWHDVILSAIPKNPIKSFSDQNVIQTIIFALFFGVALRLTEKKGLPAQELIESISFVMHQMTSMVMKFSPIGVFALMSSSVGNLGAQMLLPIALFLLIYYATCLIHLGIISYGFLRGIAGLELKPFFRNIKEALLTSISTCSSSAALPIAMKTATEKLGVGKQLSDFILPLSCSLNMNGSALFQIMASIFIADAYGIILTVEKCMTLSLTVLLATIGTASIPGAGFMTLSIVFLSTGIPLEGLVLLAGIDRLRDMATTSINIVSDIICTVVVAEKTGEFNAALFYSKNGIAPVHALYNISDKD
ncbi:MAG: dicarboxylate/amino acid:cation symporter [Chlamydia sp.]